MYAPASQDPPSIVHRSVLKSMGATIRRWWRSRGEDRWSAKIHTLYTIYILHIVYGGGDWWHINKLFHRCSDYKIQHSASQMYIYHYSVDIYIYRLTEYILCVSYVILHQTSVAHSVQYFCFSFYIINISVFYTTSQYVSQYRIIFSNVIYGIPFCLHTFCVLK